MLKTKCNEVLDRVDKLKAYLEEQELNGGDGNGGGNGGGPRSVM